MTAKLFNVIVRLFVVFAVCMFTLSCKIANNAERTTQAPVATPTLLLGKPRDRDGSKWRAEVFSKFPLGTPKDDVAITLQENGFKVKEGNESPAA